jgi:hypothetical protein
MLLLVISRLTGVKILCKNVKRESWTNISVSDRYFSALVKSALEANKAPPIPVAAAPEPWRAADIAPGSDEGAPVEYLGQPRKISGLMAPVTPGIAPHPAPASRGETMLFLFLFWKKNRCVRRNDRSN